MLDCLKERLEIAAVAGAEDGDAGVVGRHFGNGLIDNFIISSVNFQAVAGFLV